MAHLPIRLGTDTTYSMTWYTNAAKTNIKDLTGYTARVQFRPTRTSDLVILDLSTDDASPDSRVEIGTNLAGHIAIIFAVADLANITPQTAEWDMVFLDTGGDFARPLRGTAEFTYAITPAAIA